MRTLAIVAVLLLTATVADAQVVRVRVQWQECDHEVPGRCKLLSGTGTGTIIGRNDRGHSLVLTAGHIVEGDIKSVSVQGVSAKVLCKQFDQQADLAVLEVNSDLGKPAHLADTDPEVGRSYWIKGFSQDPPIERKGVLESPDMLSVTCAMGDSGGVVASNGIVFGVISGYPTRTRRGTKFTGVGLVWPMLRRCGCYQYVQQSRVRAVVQAPQQYTVPVQIPAPAPYVPPPPDPPETHSHEYLEQRIAQLEQRIAQLQSQPGPPGPPGKASMIPGPAGPPGANGLPGIAGARGPAGVTTIVLQLKTANGTPQTIQSIPDVPSGSTVTVPIEEVISSPEAQPQETTSIPQM